MHDLGWSDHSVLKMAFSNCAPIPSDQRPISKLVVADPLYAEFLQRLVGDSSLEMLAVPLRLRHFKALMREAAMLVRDQRSLRYGSDPSALS